MYSNVISEHGNVIINGGTVKSTIIAGYSSLVTWKSININIARVTESGTNNMKISGSKSKII